MKSSDLVGPVVIHTGDTIRYANQEFRELLGGVSTTDLIGEPLTAYVADRYHDALADQFAQLPREDTPISGLKLELHGADTSVREVVAVSSQIDWEGDSHIHTSFLDITTPATTPITSPQGSAVEDSPIGVTIADATQDDLPLVYVNDAFVELTGYTREEALGRNCRFLQGEGTREEPVAEMRAAIDAQRPVTVELRNYRKEGSPFWNRVSISPVEDETGTVTHFLGFQEDITDQKLYAHEKTLFETHAEMSDQVMFITDTNGIIEYVNPAFERITGYTAEEAIGRTPSILKSGEQSVEFYEDLWETIKAGDTWEADLTNRAKSGELYQAHQKIVPITDEHGDLTHFTSIEPDITDRRLERQVLKVLNRILRHNVRTAVTVIDGYAEQLEAEDPAIDPHVALEAIREQTSALDKISEKTTTVQKLLSGDTETGPWEVGRLEESVGRYRDQYPAAEFTVEFRLDREQTIRNGTVFQIALDEIVQNAVTHSEQPTPSVS